MPRSRKHLLIGDPNIVVICAMRWSGVHKARACIVSDVIAVEQWDYEIVYPMREFTWMQLQLKIAIGANRSKTS